MHSLGQSHKLHIYFPALYTMSDICCSPHAEKFWEPLLYNNYTRPAPSKFGWISVLLVTTHADSCASLVEECKCSKHGLFWEMLTWVFREVLFLYQLVLSCWFHFFGWVVWLSFLFWYFRTMSLEGLDENRLSSELMWQTKPCRFLRVSTQRWAVWVKLYE